jgi:hypothetical protein
MEKTLEPLRDQLEDTEQQIIDMVRLKTWVTAVLFIVNFGQFIVSMSSA